MSVTIANNTITFGEQTYIPALPIQDGLAYELDTSVYTEGDIGIYEKQNNTLFSLYRGNIAPEYSSDSRGVFNFNGVNTGLSGYYNAVQFPSDYVNLNYANAAYYSCSISVWVKPQSTSSQVFYCEGNYQNGLSLGLSASNYIATFCSSSVIERIQSQATSSIGSWTNITGTYESGSLSLYVNGVLVNQTSSNIIPPFLQGSVAPTIGYSNTSFMSVPINLSLTDFFTGSFGLFLKYTKALTASEVLQNYNATRIRFGL